MGDRGPAELERDSSIFRETTIFGVRRDHAHGHLHKSSHVEALGRVHA
jgi:hypothetical protein